MKGIHAASEAARYSLQKGFWQPHCAYDGLCLWADSDFGDSLFLPDTIFSLSFRAQGTPVVAAAAGSMGFHATQAVKTATKPKMVALILTQPHMYSRARPGTFSSGHHTFKLGKEESLSCTAI